MNNLNRLETEQLDNTLYNMIFKRKSFHIFKGNTKLLKSELDDILEVFKTLKPLIEDIKVEIKIVLKEETTCKRGEYCILFYSEEKENYLLNIGYLGEQLDLWLASKNIGVCWYGMGKTSERKHNELSFVIMFAIEKVEESMFRKDMYKSKRKPLEDIWIGNDEYDISNIVRFAPSACNTQPWLVKSNNKKIEVYRNNMKRGLMPKDKVRYYNTIDLGIFLLFMELCLKQQEVKYDRYLINDEYIARYEIK